MGHSIAHCSMLMWKIVISPDWSSSNASACPTPLIMWRFDALEELLNDMKGLLTQNARMKALVQTKKHLSSFVELICWSMGLIWWQPICTAQEILWWPCIFSQVLQLWSLISPWSIGKRTTTLLVSLISPWREFHTASNTLNCLELHTGCFLIKRMLDS